MTILAFCTAIRELDLFGVLAASLLISVLRKMRVPCSIYIGFLFSLYYTGRYVEIVLFNMETLFPINEPSSVGLCYLISVLFVVLIHLTLDYKNKYQYKKISFNVDKLGSEERWAGIYSKIYILLFSVATLSSAYKIGVDIKIGFYIIVVRIATFFQYLLPFIFVSKLWPFFVFLYAFSMLRFGSKAFVFTLVMVAIQYSLITNVRLKRYIVALCIAGLICSVLLFEVILLYRMTGTFDFGAIFEINTLDRLGVIIEHIAGRFGGLDTITAYAEAKPLFTLLDLYYEIISAINRFLPFSNSKLELPIAWIPSDHYTAWYFRGYDYFARSGDVVRHTDSMFGLSRFISLKDYVGIPLFVLCLFYRLVIRFRSYFLDQLFLMTFFSNVLLGGTYNETIQLFVEIVLLNYMLRISSVVRFRARHDGGSPVVNVGVH